MITCLLGPGAEKCWIWTEMRSQRKKLSFFGDRRDCSAEAAKKNLPDYLSRPRGKSKLPPIAQQLLDRANLDSISMIKMNLLGLAWVSSRFLWKFATHYNLRRKCKTVKNITRNIQSALLLKILIEMMILVTKV